MTHVNFLQPGAEAIKATVKEKMEFSDLSWTKAFQC